MAGGLSEFADDKNIIIIRIENGAADRSEVQLQGRPEGQEAGAEHRVETGRHRHCSLTGHCHRCHAHLCLDCARRLDAGRCCQSRRSTGQWISAGSLEVRSRLQSREHYARFECVAVRLLHPDVSDLTDAAEGTTRSAVSPLMGNQAPYISTELAKPTISGYVTAGVSHLSRRRISAGAINRRWQVGCCGFVLAATLQADPVGDPRPGSLLPELLVRCAGSDSGGQTGLGSLGRRQRLTPAWLAGSLSSQGSTTRGSTSPSLSAGRLHARATLSTKGSFQAYYAGNIDFFPIAPAIASSSATWSAPVSARHQSYVSARGRLWLSAIGLRRRTRDVT